MWAIVSDFLDTKDVPLIVFESESKVRTYLRRTKKLAESLKLIDSKSGRIEEKTKQLIGLDIYFGDIDEMMSKGETLKKRKKAEALMKMYFKEGGYSGCGAPYGLKIIEIEDSVPIIKDYSFD